MFAIQNNWQQRDTFTKWTVLDVYHTLLSIQLISVTMCDIMLPMLWCGRKLLQWTVCVPHTQSINFDNLSNLEMDSGMDPGCKIANTAEHVWKWNDMNLGFAKHLKISFQMCHTLTSLLITYQIWKLILVWIPGGTWIWDFAKHPRISIKMSPTHITLENLSLEIDSGMDPDAKNASSAEYAWKGNTNQCFAKHPRWSLSKCATHALLLIISQIWKWFLEWIVHIKTPGPKRK